MRKKEEKQMRSIIRNGILFFEFYGELDNLEVMKIKPVVIKTIDKHQCKTVKFDFKEVLFIDSTGIGFILARYNQIQAYGGELILKNIKPSVRKVLALSGLFSIIKAENNQEIKEVYQ